MSRKKEAKLVSMAASQIVQAALRDDVTVPELAKMAATDPAFAVRVLATVNSSAFGQPRSITDVGQASMLLGIRGMRNLALGMVVSDMAPSGEAGHVLLANCLRRAFAARELARLVRGAQEDDCFVAGLLLEAGVLARAREDFDGAVTVARAPAAHRVVRERSIGLPPHPQSGGEIARGLGLPELLISAIERHHDGIAPEDPVSRTCWLAERLAAVLESGDTESHREKAVDDAARLGIPTADVDRVLGSVPERVRDLADALGSNVGTIETMESLRERAHERLCELNQQYGELVDTLSRMIEAKEVLERELVAANARLEGQAKSDALTGLANRRVLEETLARDLARADRSGTEVSILMVDVDFFKKVNDTYGHPVGDQVIRLVAEVLKKNVRTADLAARYGGEEFTVILPETNQEGACVVAERIRKTLERSAVMVDSAELRVTASIGVASAKGPRIADSKEALLGRADHALYLAKQHGRNRVVTHPND